VIEIHPQKLAGNWTVGYALDFHTVSSVYIGDDEFGHPQFDTKRSSMGELLYRLKYKRDKSVAKILVNTVSAFIELQNFSLDVIVPVPPSRPHRHPQPVLSLAKGVGARLGIPVCADGIVKVKSTPELKNVYDFKKRLELLKAAYAIGESDLSGQKVLLIDDLYRSGATLNAVTKTLFEKGKVQKVFAITLTRTRRKS
jgi:predicted amidophosphoribosyltransferase